jgi:hypothetical protein
LYIFDTIQDALEAFSHNGVVVGNQYFNHTR